MTILRLVLLLALRSSANVGKGAIFILSFIIGLVTGFRSGIK